MEKKKSYWSMTAEEKIAYHERRSKEIETTLRNPSYHLNIGAAGAVLAALYVAGLVNGTLFILLALVLGFLLLRSPQSGQGD